jgi:hypothetical protein
VLTTIIITTNADTFVNKDFLFSSLMPFLIVRPASFARHSLSPIYHNISHIRIARQPLGKTTGPCKPLQTYAGDLQPEPRLLRLRFVQLRGIPPIV